MKITFITGSFFPETNGGTEIYILNLAKAFESNGFCVTVFTTAEVDTSYLYEGVQVVACQRENLSVHGFSKRIKLNYPDVVHFHSFDNYFNIEYLKKISELGFRTFFTPHLANNLCLRNGELLWFGKYQCDGCVKLLKCQMCISKGIKLFQIKTFAFLILVLLNDIFKLKFYNDNSYWLKSYLRVKMLRDLNQYAQNVIVVSSWMRNALLLNQLKNVVFLESGIIRRINASQWSISNGDDLTVVFAGRVSREKGIDILCKSISILKSNRVKLKLLLIQRDKDYLDELELLLKGLNVEVKFNLSQKDVQLELLNSSILCLPSRVREMSPLIVLEAFNLGLPVLTSSLCSDCIVDGSDGFIFANEDFLDLSRKIQYFLDDSSLINKMRRNFRDSRDYTDVANELISIYSYN